MQTNYKFIGTDNFGDRKLRSLIDTIIIHHTNTPDLATTVKILTNPKLKVSAHYLIDEDGSVVQMVKDEKKAWHAGQSYWRGRDHINNYSIGIEIINNGYEPFKTPQTLAVIKLCHELKDRFTIDELNIVGHADVAPNRKVDPSKYFDWKLLNENGIGIYSIKMPDTIATMHRFGSVSKEIKTLRKKLITFGYGIEGDETRYDAKLENIINAFKRHHCPETYETFGWDTLAEVRLDDLLKKHYSNAYTNSGK